MAWVARSASHAFAVTEPGSRAHEETPIAVNFRSNKLQLTPAPARCPHLAQNRRPMTEERPTPHPGGALLHRRPPHRALVVGRRRSRRRRRARGTHPAGEEEDGGGGAAFVLDMRRLRAPAQADHATARPPSPSDISRPSYPVTAVIQVARARGGLSYDPLEPPPLARGRALWRDLNDERAAAIRDAPRVEAHLVGRRVHGHRRLPLLQ